MNTDPVIDWTEASRTNARSGLFWEISARLRHPNGDTLPEVSIYVTSRTEWTVDNLAVVHAAIEAAMRTLHDCTEPG